MNYQNEEWLYDKYWNFYVYEDSCKNCSEPFLSINNAKFCDKYCANKKENNPMWGKKLSDKHKRKIAESTTGQKNHFYGKHHTKKSKMKISKSLMNINNSNYGKIFSDEYKKKLSENHADVLGSKNPNWKDGISCEPYCDVWLDKKFKQDILERDGYKCLNPLCENKTDKLCIHHINYIKKDCKPFNLITLCKSCNGKANADREWHQSFYGEIMRRKQENML